MRGVSKLNINRFLHLGAPLGTILPTFALSLTLLLLSILVGIALKSQQHPFCHVCMTPVYIASVPQYGLRAPSLTHSDQAIQTNLEMTDLNYAYTDGE